MTEAALEIETGVGGGDRGAAIHYRIRENEGRRRILVDFDLTAEQAFRVHSGSARVTVGQRSAEMDKASRILILLDRLTSDDSEESTRSLEEILRAVFKSRKVRPDLYLDLLEELEGA
jgi:hypothetical protein